MAEIVGVAGGSVVLFAATNVDDLVVLLAFFADGRWRARQVIMGQFVGIGALMVASVILALAALAVPRAWVGLLGVIPILIGLGKLRELWGADARIASDEGDGCEERPTPGRSRVLAVASVTVANGGDNLGVYVPVFALMSPLDLLAVTVTFAAMTGVWCAIGYGLVANPLVGRHIRAVGHRLLPLVLIAVGVLVLLHAETLSLIR